METPKKGDEAETTLPVLTPKIAGGSQRVIKQIMVIDPNKLRLAGLDIKMAEALKKAKKTQPKSKESKLAAAKSILNKKLKEALSKKDAANVASPKTSAKSVKSVEEATTKNSSSEKTKAGRAKPKISVATLKSLMPPPSFPVSSLISPSQTVEIKVLKSQKTTQSIEVKIVDSSTEESQKIDIFPKASLKPQIIPKTEVVTPKVKSYGRKKSNISELPEQPTEILAQASEETSEVIVLAKEAKLKSEVVTPKVKSYRRKKSCISEIADQPTEISGQASGETSQTVILAIEAKPKSEVVTPKVKSYGRKKSCIPECPDQPKEISVQASEETSQIIVLAKEAKPKTEVVTPKVKSYGRKKSCISECPDQPKEISDQASEETSQIIVLAKEAKPKTEVVTSKVKSYGRKKSCISECPDQPKEISAQASEETSQIIVLAKEAKPKTEVVTPKVKSYGRKKSCISECPDQPKEISAQASEETSQIIVLAKEAKPKTEVVTPKVKSYGGNKSCISEIVDQPKEISVQASEETSQIIVLAKEAKPKTEVVTPKVKSYGRKKSCISECPDQPKEISAQASEETSQIIVLAKEAKPKTEVVTPKVKSYGGNKSCISEIADQPKEISVQASEETSQPKASLIKNDTSEFVGNKSVTNVVEPLKDKPIDIIPWEPPPKEDKTLIENITQYATIKEDSLVTGAETSIIEASISLVDNEASISQPNTLDPFLKIVSSTPIPQKCLPKVIESKILLPGEKIDLSILTKNTPTTLTVPKKRYKLDQNWISTESNPEESISINFSPVAGQSSPKPVEQESAVDFINNLSLFFAESPKNKSLNKTVPDILTKECGEDATSFLVSLFQQKQDVSPKTPATPAQENEGSKEISLKMHCELEKEIPVIDSSLKITSDESHNQASDLDKNNSQTKEKDSYKDIKRVVKTLPETTELSESKSPSKLQSDEKIVQNSKSMITTSKTETDKQPEEIIEYHSGPTKTELNSTNRLSEENADFPSTHVSLESQTSHVSESLQKSVNKSSTPPVSSRRKASKPIPVLVPKLKKSRKPPTPAEKPPEEKIIEKPTEKPKEESPTQPVENKRALTDCGPSESMFCETEKKNLPEKSAQIETQKFQKKPAPVEQSSASSASKDSTNILDELPAPSTKDRPQRQRKMSLKLIESTSEFLSSNKSSPQAVVNKTVEETIKKNKESETPTERSQRQRKVSFKILDTSESLSTALKQQLNTQETQSEMELAPKTERPQRQRRLTLKLLESSESLPSMKSLVPLNSRSEEQEIKEKTELDTSSETSQWPKSSTKNKNSDGLVAIEMMDDSLKDPIAQVAVLNETVGELACGSVNSKRIQNESTHTEGEGSSSSEHPFYDAICVEISSEKVESNQPTVGKENVSSEQTSTKNLRRRKDSLKSRTFLGDQISIVPSDSSDICDRIAKNIEKVPSSKQIRNPKETPTICPPDIGEVTDMLELTPKPTEAKPHARNLISEMAQNEEMFNNSAVLENLNTTSSFPKLSQTINTDTPTNTSGKKRRGRPPKLKKLFPKLKVEASYNETGMEESFLATDDQRVIEVKLLKESEVSAGAAAESLVLVEQTNSNLGGSPETLPSADENVRQEFTSAEKSVSKSNRRKTEKSRLNSCSSNSRSQGRIPENKNKVDKPDKVSVIAEDSPTIAHMKTEDVSQVSEGIKGEEGPINEISALKTSDERETLKSMKPITETPQNNSTDYKNHSLLIDDYTCPPSPIKGNKSESIKDLPVNKPHSSDSFEQSEMRSSDSLKPIQAEYKVSDGQSSSKTDSCSHPQILETPKASDVSLEGDEHLSIKQSTTRNNLFEEGKLPEKSRDIEILNTSSSAPHTNASQIKEQQITPNDELLDEPKSPTSESKRIDSKEQNDFPNTKEPSKIAPEYEDLMFDFDHIESPSFSPICESSRISSDLDGFEEFGEDLTSAIINTVTEAENAAEKSKELEKSTNPSVDGEKSSKDLKSKEELKISGLVELNSVIVTQFSSNSTENPKPTENSESISVKESSPLQSIDASSLPSSHISMETSRNITLTDDQNAPSSSALAKKYTEEADENEPTKSEEVKQSSAVNDPSLQEKAGKEKESQLIGNKSLEDLKPSHVIPNSALNSTYPCNKSPNKQRSKETSTENKTKQSSALCSQALKKSKENENEKDTSKHMVKNPFKKQILKDSENESEIKSDFLGFNEKEIEEGQQSTSLRLSQSEDVESQSIELPSVSKIKPKHNIKESQSNSGKKKKPEKQKWEKNSAKTLKNWLSKNVKSDSNDDVCDIQEDIKQSSPVAPKKRRSKVQSLAESIPLEKDARPQEQEIYDTETTVKSKIEADVSVIEKTINSTDKREKPKRLRKSKLKNSLEVEKNSSEKITSSSDDTNLVSKLVIAKTPTEDTPKRQEAINDDDFKTPKRGRKPKGANQSIGSKKELAENLPSDTKEIRNKRKRSMSEENTPKTLEPPTKIVHLDGTVLPPKRKPGRPRKFALDETIPVPVVMKSPKEKKYKDDYEFNPRLLLIRKKEELKSNEPLVDPSLQTEPIGPDDVQCALCMGYTPKKKWIQHVSTHYGIGWIVGNPPPLNINSRGSILSFLLEFYKVSKLKGLNCRLCNSLRRSALGLLMHLEQCCLTEAEITESRIVCEYCKRNYTKSSYLVHKRTCSEYLKQVLEESKVETPEIPEGTTSDDVLSNTGRLKRRAVIMAETKLKKLDETTEFVADDLIKYIPSKSIEAIKENWIMEINSFGKGFCVSKACPYTATAIDDLIDHYQDKICPYYEKPGYFCVKCKFHSENIETVRSHVLGKHSPKLGKEKCDSDADFGSSESSESIASDDDEVESESGSTVEDENGERKPKRSKKPKSKARRRAFQSKHPPTKEYKKLIPERCSILNIQDIVAQFYDKFIEENYSLDPLFTFARANYVQIEASESYFPKSANSIKYIHNGFNGFVKTFGQSKVEVDQWKQLERLQGRTENGEYIIYMGGPVKNIVWVPLDPHPPSSSQYLAVTVRKGLDKFTRFLNQKRSRSLIFILKFDISLPLEIKAEIIYAIAIDEGPIHAIEFLPSGGYSPEMNRLGMLAVGTIETEIKIYSLPLEVEKNDCDLFPIVKLEASIELHLDVLDSAINTAEMYNSQCTCLLWSQSAGHNIIVASFLNGFVGIWDVSDDPGNLNRFNINNSKRFTPVSFFWTLEDRLLHLALHYDMNGPRWLAASNSTRKLLIYDLRDITQPILMRVEVTINIINCVQWPNVWENIMFGLGDTMPSNGCVISVLSPMYIMFATRRFEKFCTGVSDIHFNIWRNCFAAGADNGDVQVTPLREAVLDVAQRLKIDEKTISTLDIVPLNGENISQNGIQTPKDGMRVFDKDFKDQYGIVFGSVRKIKGCNKPDYYSTQRVPPLNLHRLMRISKIRFNQNKNACDVLAVGYENGLLRVNVHEWQKKA